MHSGRRKWLLELEKEDDENMPMGKLNVEGVEIQLNSLVFGKKCTIVNLTPADMKKYYWKRG